MDQQTAIRHDQHLPRRLMLALSGFLMFVVIPQMSSASAASEKLSYNRDVRPILADKCFHCHGPDAKTRKADLRLDMEEGSRVAASDGVSGYVIQPGKPDESLLIDRIRSTDESTIMPPPESKKPLTPAQVEILTRWVSEGAEYQKHWSFEPVRDVTPPNAGPSAHPVDQFLNAEISRKGLSPQPEASRETMIRRVAFTLTGLPPRPEEVEAYLSDRASGAYERMVDRYLKSPQYGEEMAKHWLDVARYADTHGLHLDNERQMWAYRDWVISAFNSNLPFDQFTVWQLAGDLLPNPTQEQLVATGFNRCNVTTSEGGSIPEEFVYRYAVERTTAVTQAWLGLTAGCAVCHDHKYDPITSKEFYSLYAFFNSAADPAMDGNTNVTAPFLKLPTMAEKQTAEAELQKELAARTKLDDLARKLVAANSLNASVNAGAASGTENAASRRAVEDVLLDDALPPGTQVRSSSRNPLDWVTDPKFAAHSGRRVLRQSSASDTSDQFEYRLQPLAVPHDGVLRFSIWTWWPDIPAKITIGALSGRPAVWVRDGNLLKREDGDAVIEHGKWNRVEIPVSDLGLNPGDPLTGIRLTQSGGVVWWDHVTISGQSDPSVDPRESFVAWRKALGTSVPPELPAELHPLISGGPEKELSETDSASLRSYYLAMIARPTDAALAETRHQWETAREARIVAEDTPPGTFIFRDLDKPRDSFVMVRGQYDKPGEKVEPAVPAVLPPIRKATPDERLTRKHLAEWLTADDNPLTARVTVNRLWQQVFGTGLVKTSYDFGTQGESPSHPELLDWLAIHFRKSGWDTKEFMKLLLTSDAFRRSPALTVATRTADPANRLLSRGARFRLDAEQVRDNVLFVSGLMDLTMGGRGVRPYQPANIWEPVGYSDSNTRFYLQDRGQSLYRRSIYAFLKRTAPPPFMSNFDAPNREQVCTVRERSNTPLQALQLMNDVQHFEAARALAERTLNEGGTTSEQRFQWLYRTVLSRRADPEELQILNDALRRQNDLFAASPENAMKATRVGESSPRNTHPAVETAAWTMVCNLVLNLDETLNRN
jgi:hypothetical protein